MQLVKEQVNGQRRLSNMVSWQVWDRVYDQVVERVFIQVISQVSEQVKHNAAS